MTKSATKKCVAVTKTPPKKCGWVWGLHFINDDFSIYMICYLRSCQFVFVTICS